MNAVSNVSTRMILLQERERIKWRKEIISVLSTFLFFFFFIYYMFCLWDSVSNKKYKTIFVKIWVTRNICFSFFHFTFFIPRMADAYEAEAWRQPWLRMFLTSAQLKFAEGDLPFGKDNGKKFRRQSNINTL